MTPFFVEKIGVAYIFQNGVAYMEDTVHYETLITQESLAGVRTFIYDGGVQLSCARQQTL